MIPVTNALDGFNGGTSHCTEEQEVSVTWPSVDTRASPQMKYCVSVDYMPI